jgi:hypothetical protein
MYDMNDRIATLEHDLTVLKADVSVLKTDLAQLKTDVAVILANYSTKADIARLETTLLKWGFGSVIALAGIVVAAAKYIH